MTAARNAVSDYRYSSNNHRWLVNAENVTVIVYGFDWTGVSDGNRHGGNGRATRAFSKRGSKWQLPARVGPIDHYWFLRHHNPATSLRALDCSPNIAGTTRRYELAMHYSHSGKRKFNNGHRTFDIPSHSSTT